MKLRINTPKIEFPWLWIGACYSDHRMINVTSFVEEQTCSGDLITRDRLAEITGITDTVTWKYIDKTTLNELEIPSDGILI